VKQNQLEIVFGIFEQGISHLDDDCLRSMYFSAVYVMDSARSFPPVEALRMRTPEYAARLVWMRPNRFERVPLNWSDDLSTKRIQVRSSSELIAAACVMCADIRPCFIDRGPLRPVRRRRRESRPRKALVKLFAWSRRYERRGRMVPHGQSTSSIQ
jgi:hypothetical protein